MPPRRSHKKSRAGCRRCKNRKIKCDEVHPRCGNCVKHGVLCDFENPDIVEDLTTPTADESPLMSSPPGFNAPLTPSIQGTPAPPPPLSPLTTIPTPHVSLGSLTPSQVDRLMELRIMHHYTTETSKTLLINSPVAEEIWQIKVPQMALSGKTYLANAILSIAALHLRSLHPEDKSIIRASHAYAAVTFADYRGTLDRGITTDNAEALFLTASLLAIHSTASRMFIKEDDPNDRYQLPVAWFHAFQGVKTLTASSWMWIRDSVVVRAVINSQPGVHLDLNPRGPSSFFGHILEGIDDELASENPRFAVVTSQSYAHAVCVLNWAHHSPIPAAALAFPATISRRFIDLVEAKRPRALAILACFFALLKRMDGVWWLHEVSRREVMGLVGIFEPGSKWWRHLEWPIRIALWDSGTIPSDIWGADCGTAPQQDDKANQQTIMDHMETMTRMVKQYEDVLPDPGSPD
jgi:hypothetical protein